MIVHRLLALVSHTAAVAAICCLHGIMPSAVSAQTNLRVIDETDRPLAGVQVFVQEKPKFPIPSEVVETTPTLTDAQGKYTPPDPVAGNAFYVFSKQGYASRAFPVDKSLPAEVRLSPGQELTGTVVNDKGTSLAGALLGPADPAGAVTLAGREKEPILTTRTNESGEFTLHGLPKGKFDVLVQAAGACTRLVQITSGVSKRVVMDAGGTTVTGTVRGSKARDLRSDVYVEASSAGIKLYAITDAFGRFTFPHLSSREWIFRAVVQARDISHPQVTLSVASQKEPYEIELMLNQGIKIGGTIVDAETSQPLADLRISLEMDGRREGKTESDGSFLFENVQNYSGAVIRFDDIKYSYAVSETDIRTYVEIPPSQGEDLTTLSIALRPRSHITGKVLSPVKHPVPNAKVTARAVGSTRRVGKSIHEAEYMATSALDGKFHCNVFPSGAYELTASLDKLISMPVTVETYTTASAEVNLELRMSSTVSGLVTDSQDNPVTETKVQIFAAATGETDPSVTRPVKSMFVDEKGAFNFEELPPQNYTLIAENSAFAQKATATVDLSTGTSVSQAVKFPAGYDFIGFVTDDEGNPIRDIQVQLMYSQAGEQKVRPASTAHDGQVAFRALPVSKADRVLVRIHPFADFEASAVPLPQTSFDIKLRRKGTLSVTVQQPQVPPPADGSTPPKPTIFLLLAHSEGSEGAAPAADLFTSLDSKQGTTATFEGLSPGWYKAAAKLNNRYAESEAVQLAATGITKLEVLLEGGGVVRGRVTDKEKRAPLANTVINLVPIAGAFVDVKPVTALSRTDGTFEIPGAPSGAALVTAVMPGYPEVELNVNVLPRGETKLNIEISSALARVSGRVTYGGQGLANALLVLHKTGKGETPFGSAISDGSGNYTISDAPPGKFQLVVEAAIGENEKVTNKQVEVNITPPETRQDVAFQKLRPVTGTMRIEGSTKSPGPTTLLFNPKGTGGQTSTVEVDADGKFKVDLEPGPYSVGWEDRPGIDAEIPAGDSQHKLDLVF